MSVSASLSGCRAHDQVCCCYFVETESSEESTEMSEPAQDNDVEDYSDRISYELQQDKKGLAIVIGMKSAEDAGALVDAKNMKASFEALNFAVLDELKLSLGKLRALVKAAANFQYTSDAPSCRVVAFYFAGHGNFDGGPCVHTNSGGLRVDDIVSPFYPENASHLKDIKRLFFDTCLREKEDSGF